MQKYAKFYAAAVAAVAVVASSGLLPAHVAQWVNVVVASAGAAAVYFIPNAEAPAFKRRF